MKLHPTFLLLCLVMAAATSSSQAQRPLPDDLALPLPDKSSMVFRPVLLDVDTTKEGPLAQRSIKVGGGTDFRERPVLMQLSGAFPKDHDGRQDRSYFIGKCEVTVAQYAAVMRTAGSPPEVVKANLPKTSVSWLEAQEFVARYNEWLFGNARSSLPSVDGVPGHVRLPTEVEWEFAARGGAAVDAAQFEKSVPYAGDLARFEWFGGARSSFDKLKEAGQLDPNPLGIHDMLGNAAEMVEGLYQIEYIQARPGGRIVRGGSFRTPEQDIRASARMEQFFCDSHGSPSRSDDVGFRLVISAPVFAGFSSLNQIRDAWPAYVKSAKRNVPMPPLQAAAPAVAQTQTGVAEVQAHIERQMDTINGQVPQQELLEKLSLLKASMADVQTQMLKADKELAVGSAFQASVSAYRMTSFLLKLELEGQNAQALGFTPAELQARQDGFKRGLKITQQQFIYALNTLVKVRPDSAEEAFEFYISTTRAQGDDTGTKAAERAYQIYLEYEKSRVLRMDAWEEGFKEDARIHIRKE